MSATPPMPPPGTLDHPSVKQLFDDPRFKHLVNFGDYDDSEADELNYDRALTLQAAASVYSIISAEKQGQVIARATWGLVIATVGLVVATIVLVIVTVQGG